MRSVHEGIMFNCEQCNYRTAQKGSIQRHVLSVHEGVTKYNCELCAYMTYRKRDLRQHIKAVHDKPRVTL